VAIFLSVRKGRTVLFESPTGFFGTVLAPIIPREVIEMDMTWIVILAALILTGPYLLLPVAVVASDSKTILKCPESGELAEIKINGRCAEPPSRKASLKVEECSLWARRNCCAQTCLKLERR
jgi:hypothetical protein